MRSGGAARSERPDTSTGHSAEALLQQKIVFITPYPEGVAPNQRFRFEQYLDLLTASGYNVIIRSFLDLKTFEILYRKGSSLAKVVGVLKGFCRRVRHVFECASADYVFIAREASPIGPPVFEWLVARVLGKKIIYDYDDAIWLTDIPHEGRLQKTLKWRSKVASICRWSYRVSCGNEYLCAYARKYNKAVVLNPTTIDSENLHTLNRMTSRVTAPLTIGWTGSHSTLKYLHEIVPALRMLEQTHHFTFLVIADRAPDLPLRNVKFIPWSLETEISVLSQIDIGVMPLPDDEWTKGKCGFKILQYMALAIPSVASHVGVNDQIITHGVNGFLCRTTEDWVANLEALMLSETLRKRLGTAGYSTVINSYSAKSNTANFLSLFGYKRSVQ